MLLELLNKKRAIENYIANLELLLKCGNFAGIDDLEGQYISAIEKHINVTLSLNTLYN